jgi:hypothetical protein
MKELQEDLWPPPDKRSPMEQRLDGIIRKSKDPIWKARKASLPPLPKKPRERLKNAEVVRLFTILADADLVIEPISHGMFGGVGLRVYEHEQFIGTGPEHLLTIVDKHLPETSTTSWHRKLLGESYAGRQKLPGGVRDDAWDLCMKFAKKSQNVAWLKQYKLKAPRERVHYEY